MNPTILSEEGVSINSLSTGLIECFARKTRFAQVRAVMISKYIHVVGVGIQNTLVYRVNFFLRATFGLIPLMATIYLWRTVYASKEGDAEVAGYTLAQMTSYYLVVVMVDALTAVAEDDWQIASDIKDGYISQFLLKPVDYMLYRLSLFGAGRVIFTLSAMIPVGLFVWMQREYFMWPNEWGTWIAFGISVVLTALLQFFISYTMALLAFWVLEVSTFIFILFAFEYIASGHLFPLDILPPAIERVLYWTPFPYQMFFPVSIYLGQTEGVELWTRLGIQAGWVFGIFLLGRWIWLRGIRRYSSVGG